MERSDTHAGDLAPLQNVIVALESQLIELDQMRLHIAAAHVNSAIQHLRFLYDAEKLAADDLHKK